MRKCFLKQGIQILCRTFFDKVYICRFNFYKSLFLILDLYVDDITPAVLIDEIDKIKSTINTFNKKIQI